MRPEWHVLIHPCVLHLEAERIHAAGRARVWAPDRGTTDLRRRRDVPGHERGRHRKHIGVVIEPEPRHVAREQRPAINLQV